VSYRREISELHRQRTTFAWMGKFNTWDEVTNIVKSMEIETTEFILPRHLANPTGPRIRDSLRISCAKTTYILCLLSLRLIHKAIMSYVEQRRKIVERLLVNAYIYIVTRICDYRRGFWIGDWIYCTLYVHNSGVQAIQRYRWSTHFPVHRYTRTKILSLH
jgi:hypothetical protein